ncbi:MAG: hypothetical protein WBL20_10320 [Sphingobium sp.]|uniref:hypothetical protein n=1 Tax=Sphingobium sp. TaxID=1912891 RepID=UPI003BB061D5
MANILITPPTPIAALVVSRGSGAANLLTTDPREVWLDSTVGTPVTIDIDFGIDRIIDTLFLGCLFAADQAATWTISGGLAAYAERVIKPAGKLRVAERDWRRRVMSHALWFGAEQLVRYLRISITQPVGASPLAIGALVAGEGFQPRYNKEWGSGRGVRDTGTVTRLSSGGVAIVEGARFATYSWTLGDLTDDEVDKLYELHLDRGESRPLLVVEDPADTAGLRNRIRYGALTGLRAYERRNAVQTSWQMSMEDWAIEPDPLFKSQSVPALTLGGMPLTLGGQILTLGD